MCCDMAIGAHGRLTNIAIPTARQTNHLFWRFYIKEKLFQETLIFHSWYVKMCIRDRPFTASSNFHPHFGQYTGRILSLMSFCSTSFLPWRKPVTPFRQSQSGCRGAGLRSVRSYSTMSVSQCATGLERSRALRYAISKVRQVFPR